jgi:hypothetical protein
MPLGHPLKNDRMHWTLFRNDATEAVPPFGLVRITGTALVNGQNILTGAKPNDTFQRYYGVNAGGTVPAGKIGELTLSPYTIVRVESVTAGTGPFGAMNNQWGLEPNRPGFTSMGLHTNDRGLYLIEAVQEPVAVLTGVTDAQITAGGSGTVSIHFMASGTPSEYNVTGHLDWMHGSENISASKQVLLSWVDGQWLITGAECEA